MRKILNFNELEDFESALFDQLEQHDRVNLVADFDTIWEVAQDISMELDGKPDYINMDSYEYDKEYSLEVYKDDGQVCYAIDQIYDYDSEKYYGMDGVTFVDHEVSPKYIQDVEANKMIKDFVPVLYSIGEASNECDDCALEKQIDGTRAVYYVPICFDDLIDNIDSLIDDFFEECFR